MLREDNIAWIDIMRVGSCFVIFLHHFLKTNPSFHYYTVAVITAVAFFLFIAGVLAQSSNKTPEVWLKDRLVTVFVPLWIVLVPLLILNEIFLKKSITLYQLLIELFGGALFVGNPFYEAPWFVTLIVLLYVVSFLMKKNNSLLFMVFVFCLILYGFYYLRTHIIYFISIQLLYLWIVSFFIGYNFFRAKKIRDLSKTINIFVESKIDYSIINLFKVGSNYTYHFYLVHGPILFFLSKVFIREREVVFLAGIGISAICSLVVKRLSDFIAGSIVKRRENCVPVR